MPANPQSRQRKTTRSRPSTTSRQHEPPAGPRDLVLFERFALQELTDEAYNPLVIAPFQRTVLADHFGGISELVVVIPKKNGKSALLAALAIFHLLTVPFAEVAIVAASRDQAGRLLRLAQGMVKRSPALRARIVIKQRELINEALDGRIQILPADPDTVDGWLGSLFLVDEYHRHKSAEIYGLGRDGIGPRRGQMATISTAGDNEGSPLGELRASALSSSGVVVEGAHKTVRLPNMAYHEWSLGRDDDVNDLDLVLEANPAPWVDLSELKRRQTPSLRPWQWARFTCGQWVAGEDAAISDVEWRNIAEPGLEIPRGVEDVYIGMDFGWKHDATAMVPVWKDPDTDVVRVHPPVIMTPPGDGTSLLVDDMMEHIHRLANRWPNVRFVLDPEAGGEVVSQRIEAEIATAKINTHSQKAGPMSLAAERLSSAIANKKLRHPDDGDLNAHVLAAAAKSVGESWRFAKQPGKKARPIDGCIALAMAHSALVGPSNETPPPVDLLEYRLQRI